MSRRVLDPAHLADHVDRLYRAAWALCDSREDAEDLVQDTYARVLARPRWLRGEDDLGYLLRVLRNTHISRLPARPGHPAHLAPAPGRPPAEWRSVRRGGARARGHQQRLAPRRGAGRRPPL